jgi:hypothetical protein
LLQGLAVLDEIGERKNFFPLNQHKRDKRPSGYEPSDFRVSHARIENNLSKKSRFAKKSGILSRQNQKNS